MAQDLQHDDDDDKHVDDMSDDNDYHHYNKMCFMIKKQRCSWQNKEPALE